MSHQHVLICMKAQGTQIQKLKDLHLHLHKCIYSIFTNLIVIYLSINLHKFKATSSLHCAFFKCCIPVA